VRIVCATNRDPWDEVQNGRFREDLYYRLQVVPIPLPPLRERNGDTLLLAHFFLQRYARDEGKGFRGFDPEVESIFARYDWPGNVRQLQNVIRNITVLHDAEQVRLAHLPPPLNNLAAEPRGASGAALHEPGAGAPATGLESIRPLAEIEREAIERAIALCDGNVPQAAALLRVHPSTLYRKKQAWAGKD
jgi:two-component system repressor protein LuxO